MSEKKAKEQRKGGPKIIHKMTIEVADLGNGQASIGVNGIPADFSHAMGMLTDAIKVVTKKFVEAAQEGNVEMGERSRIIPAHALPPGGFGSA